MTYLWPILLLPAALAIPPPVPNGSISSSATTSHPTYITTTTTTELTTVVAGTVLVTSVVTVEPCLSTTLGLPSQDHNSAQHSSSEGGEHGFDFGYVVVGGGGGGVDSNERPPGDPWDGKHRRWDQLYLYTGPASRRSVGEPPGEHHFIIISDQLARPSGHQHAVFRDRNQQLSNISQELNDFRTRTGPFWYQQLGGAVGEAVLTNGHRKRAIYQLDIRITGAAACRLALGTTCDRSSNEYPTCVNGQCACQAVECASDGECVGFRQCFADETASCKFSNSSSSSSNATSSSASSSVSSSTVTTSTTSRNIMNITSAIIAASGPGKAMTTSSSRGVCQCQPKGGGCLVQRDPDRYCAEHAPCSDPSVNGAFPAHAQCVMQDAFGFYLFGRCKCQTVDCPWAWPAVPDNARKNRDSCAKLILCKDDEAPTAPIFVLAALLVPLSAANICKSRWCHVESRHHHHDRTYHSIDGTKLSNLAAQIIGASWGDDKTFKSGEHIACGMYAAGPTGFCFFAENLKNGNITGAEVKALTTQIFDAGCHGCAAVGLQDNDSGVDGYLKVDKVGNVHGCKGLC
ncbi:hypothetical protein PLICBS_003113 [Purpureocillium lilacinum]|uniref:uncharacterized protein n=1 Tax=Purpureocillium lilacinum TaxID=33203 RepID=UPI0020821EBC|nr:hypothetical protein PLICBS_003113 [Purpureocillium lilacinum]